MQSPVPGEVRRASPPPPGQAAEPRNESVLQAFNLAKYKLSLDKNHKFPHVIYTITILRQYYSITI